MFYFNCFNSSLNEKESYEHLSLKNMSVSCYKNAKARREMKLFASFVNHTVAF